MHSGNEHEACNVRDASRNCPCDNAYEVLSAKLYHVDQPYDVDIHPAADQSLHFDINTKITPYGIHYTI